MRSLPLSKPATKFRNCRRTGVIEPHLLRKLLDHDRRSERASAILIGSPGMTWIMQKSQRNRDQDRSRLRGKAPLHRIKQHQAFLNCV